jgi:hypothetical protein
MTIRPKLILALFAIILSVASCPSFAQIQASSANLAAPLAASAPTAVPALVPYTGVAVDRDGRALRGETGITFLIYKDQNGGEPLFTETQSVVPDLTGHYTVRLGASMSSGIPLDLFSSGEARWLEVQVAGQAVQPRVLLVSVPYAIKAGDASTLGGLPASAYALAGSRAFSTTTASSLAATAITPNVTSNVTTTGGTVGFVPVFTGSTSVGNSILFQNTTANGIGVGGTPSSGTELDVFGKAVVRGVFNLSRAGNATSSTGYNSYPFIWNSSAYNSSSKTDVAPIFALEAEVAGNNTANPSATFNLLYGHNGGTPAESGLYFNSNGTIHFAPGQTFPGGTGGGGAAICIATEGGFGTGGTTFVGPSFAVPAGGGCSPWSGFTKTASTVVLTTSGAGCLSSDGKKLTLSVSSADPSYLGAGSIASDYIQLTRSSTTGSFTSGSDQGYFNGSAVQVTCTSSLLQLNENND